MRLRPQTSSPMFGLSWAALLLTTVAAMTSCGESPDIRKNVQVKGSGPATSADADSAAKDKSNPDSGKTSGNYSRIQDAINSAQQKSPEKQGSSASDETKSSASGGQSNPSTVISGADAVKSVTPVDPTLPNPNDPPIKGDEIEKETVKASNLELSSKFANSISATMEALCSSGAGPLPLIPENTPFLKTSTEGDDTLTGGSGPDLIQGLAGNDTISGLDGDDLLHGNQGNDRIGGGPGNDWVFGGSEDDTLNGGEGNDAMVGGKGNDAVFGDNGNDQIFGEDGHDKLDGGPGNDRIDGGPGSDELQGGEGSDFLGGNDDNDTVRGGSGNDCINGGNGNDLVVGGGGSDVIRGGPGSDVFHPLNETISGECNDATFAGCSQDWLFGDPADGTGGGNDTFIIGDKAGLVVIMPDLFGNNIVDCRTSTKPSLHRENDDLFLLSGTTLIRVVDFFKANGTKMTFTTGCQ